MKLTQKRPSVLVICSRYCRPLPLKPDVVIGVETGCLEIIDRHLPLHWAVGDFDHVNSEQYALIKQKSGRVWVKNDDDQLDGELGIKIALKHYPTADICLIAHSNQTDLLISGINLVHQYHLTAWLNDSYVKVLSPGHHQIPYLPHFRYFSLFCFTVDSVVSVQKARYCYTNLKIRVCDNRASRNLFLSNKTPVEVTVISGLVTVIVPPHYDIA